MIGSFAKITKIFLTAVSFSSSTCVLHMVVSEVGYPQIIHLLLFFMGFFHCKPY